MEMSKTSEDVGSCEVCGQPASQKCSGCRLVFYCSQEHQKNNWQAHKNQCRPFEIEHSKGLGRHLKATRDLKPGDLIFTELPLLSGPLPHLISDFLCVGCGKILQEVSQKCLECSWPVCGVDCEGLSNNTKHGLECRILRTKETPLRFDVLIILRSLFLQKTNKTKWNQILELEAHLEHRGPGSEVFQDVEDKVQFLQENFLEHMPEDIDCSPRIIRKIYAILDVNATELIEDYSLEILYPTASLIEHNCTPNTYQIIDRETHKITFKAAVDIQSGKHITSTYTNILWGTFQRQQHLKTTKYFLCQCKRCKDPTELETFMSCLKCLCGGLQLPQNPLDEKTNWLCDKCGILLPCVELMKFVEHLGGEVEKMLHQQTTRGQLEELRTKMLRFLHPNHFHVFQIKHTLIQLMENDERKIQLCQELIDITEKIDPGSARLSLYLAVILNELYKAKKGLSSDVDLEELRGLLRRGVDVLEKEIQTSRGAHLRDLLQKNLDNIL